MKKLKLILLFSVLVLMFTYIRIKNNHKSYYSVNDNYLSGRIVEIKTHNNRMTLVVKAKEKVLVNCYDCDNNIIVGDYIKAKGIFKKPNKNTVFNLFDYQNYLKSKKITWIFNAESYEIQNNSNFFYKLKNKIINRVEKINNNYLDTFILGVNEIENNINSIYQKNGVSHLFSISGMHISLMTMILLNVLKKIIKVPIINYILITLFLIFYMFLTNFSPSVLRASLLFIGLGFNKVFNWNFNATEILIIIFNLLIIYNPYYFYSISFLYSFIISGYLIVFKNLLNKFNNYFVKIFIVSLIAFLVSIPITINNFFTINLLSPFINVISVPLITVIIFPLSLLSFVFPILNNLLVVCLNYFEQISVFLSKFSINLDFGKIDVFLILIYYIIVTSILIKVKKYKIFVLFITLFLLYNQTYFNLYPKITFIDVGQGDSALIQLPYNQGNILIDTGGNKDYDLSKNIIIPFLKSLGIKKIDYLILTHGDFDHMGSSIDLVDNFKIERVIMNSYKNNDLETELIKKLDKKKIKYFYYNNKILNINNYKLYFLNKKHYDENEDSLVVYTKLNNYKFLFMGDAGEDVEEDLIKKYNLQDIDVLKVGHHGSRTSSSKNFIDEINPKYSIISVGKNNRYGHPNKEVLSVLDKFKIYRTDQDGSIIFKIKNNELKIETCTS